MKGWSKRSIGDIAKVTSSKRIFLSDYVEFGIPFWRSKEVIEQFHGKNVSTELFIAKEKYNEIKAKFGVPNKGDILLTSVGTVGVPHLVRNDSPFYFKDGNLTWVKDIIEEVEPYYIYLWLSSNVGQKEIQNNLIGSSQKALTIDSLKKIKIPLPPLPLQKKIAGILSAYDDLIENNLRALKLLEEMAQITYEEWFVRLRFPGHATTPINPTTGLPEGWKKVKLREVLKLNYGKALKADTRIQGSIPVYGSSGIVGMHNFALVDGVGIIVGRKGNVGSVFWSHDSFYPIDTVYFVTSLHELHFLYYALRNSKFDNSDAAVPGLNRDAAYAVEITLPPKNIEKHFADLVEQNFLTIQLFEEQNQRLREARDILLPRLMTGVIDVEKYPAVVMPLQNGTQKEVGLGPDFRRDDGKGRDDGTKNNNNEVKL